jgi:hypothetical protein
VVECAGLEIRCTCKRTVGSNPTLSANCEPKSLILRGLGLFSSKGPPPVPPSHVALVSARATILLGLLRRSHG